jgi:drug/metabolite transporter (DMT)-like permease
MPVNQKKAYIFAVLTILCWSTIASAFKLTLRYIDYFQLLFISTTVSLIILYLILLVQKKSRLLRETGIKDLARASVRGLLNPFLYYLVLLKAYSLLKAQEAGTLNYIWPVTLVLLSVPLLKQKISFFSFLAILLSFSGIVVISTEGDFSIFRFREPLGVLLALGSSFFWSLYWILNMKDKTDEIVKLFLNFVFGTLYLIPVIFLTSGLYDLSFKGIAGAVYIGFFEMGITFYFWLNALKHSANTAIISQLIYLSPFLSLLIIRVMVGEKILFSTIAGLSIIVAGIILQQWIIRKSSTNKF